MPNSNSYRKYHNVTSREQRYVQQQTQTRVKQHEQQSREHYETLRESLSNADIERIEGRQTCERETND